MAKKKTVEVKKANSRKEESRKRERGGRGKEKGKKILQDYLDSIEE
jgi:hypothetical protein